MQLASLTVLASDVQGNVVVGANVSITTPALVAAQIYNGAAWVNSVVTDARGMVSGAYVIPGDYIVTINHASIGSIVYTWTAAPSKRPLVSVLPTNAASVDGDEVYYQNATMAAGGAVWHLRYNAAGTAAKRWEYVGGAALAKYLGNEHTTSTAYVDITPANPHNLTIPLLGDYEVDWGAQTYNATVTYSWMGIFFGTSPAALTFQAETTTYIGSPNSQLPITSAWGFSDMPAGGDIRARYRVTGGDATFLGRYLRIRPIRVGP